MERYYQPEIECASREQIRAWQNERLLKQVKNVWDNVPYYREKMQQKGFEKNGRIAYNRFKSNMSDEDCPRHCDRTQGRRSKPGGTSYSRGN